MRGTPKTETIIFVIDHQGRGRALATLNGFRVTEVILRARLTPGSEKA